MGKTERGAQTQRDSREACSEKNAIFRRSTVKQSSEKGTEAVSRGMEGTGVFVRVKSHLMGGAMFWQVEDGLT